MRIQYLFDRPLPATETDSEQVMQTVASLARAGLGVELVLPARRGAPPPDADALRAYYKVEGAFQVRSVPSPWFGWPTARKIHHALATTRALGAMAAPDPAEVVYTRNFPTLFALARRGVPFVYETYRPWFEQFSVLRPAFRSALGKAMCLGVVLHSRFAAEKYAALGLPPEKVLVAHNGYDPSLLRSAPGREEARRTLGLPLDRPIVAYTGHVNATKGVETIVEMAVRCPEALFLLVGWDGRPGLVERRARGVANVQLVPWQPFDRVAWYLKLADVLLLPPSARGLAVVGNTVLPMKVFQYLAAERPIVAPRTPDVLELLVDGENALLTEPGDVEAAGAAVRRVLGDGALRERLAAGARRTAAGLTWDARAKGISGFLEARLEVVQGRAPGRA